MSRKPTHHKPPETVTVNDRLEKSIKSAEIAYEVKAEEVPPPKGRADAVLSLHHPLYPPSSLPAIAICPARVRMGQGLPDLPESEDASEGRMLHSAVKAGDVALDSEQAELVRKCRDLISELSENDTGHVFHEERISVFGTDFQELTFGTADIVILFDDKVKIIEEKYGRNEVEEAANNLQLACYAVGAAQKYGVDKVECHVFQPRINRHSSYTFTDISAVLASIEAVIDKSKAPAWIYHPCEEACRYCKAKFTCEPCLRSLSALPAVAAVPEADKALVLAKTMPKLIPAAKQAAKLAEAILSRAKEMIAAGTPIEGFCLKEGNEVRFVADILKAFESTKDFIPQDEFLKLCSVSVGAYEEKFIEKLRADPEYAAFTLDECKAEFSKRVQGAIGKKQNRANLAEVKVKK